MGDQNPNRSFGQTFQESQQDLGEKIMSCDRMNQSQKRPDKYRSGSKQRLLGDDGSHALSLCGLARVPPDAATPHDSGEA